LSSSLSRLLDVKDASHYGTTLVNAPTRCRLSEMGPQADWTAPEENLSAELAARHVDHWPRYRTSAPSARSTLARPLRLGVLARLADLAHLRGGTRNVRPDPETGRPIRPNVHHSAPVKVKVDTAGLSVGDERPAAHTGDSPVHALRNGLVGEPDLLYSLKRVSGRWTVEAEISPVWPPTLQLRAAALAKYGLVRPQ
jgi:hypothetical protein